MKAIVSALLGGIMLVGFIGDSLAMPKGRPGDTRCRCKCSGGNSSKYLDWAKTATCGNSNGKSCNFSWDGKTSTQGTLSNCEQCENQGGGDWLCGNGPAALKSRIPAGTVETQPTQPLQPKQPSQPPATSR